MSLGAKGYILKGIGSDELVGALKAVLNDQSYVSPEFAMKLVTAANAGREAEHANRYLNVREVQVITEVEKGLTNRQIAERLKISEQTVKYYMTSLMQKYGVTNRTLAVLEHRKHATH
jgi:two-component system, NarL family, nitrate/nitrite response regulator NarL